MSVSYWISCGGDTIMPYRCEKYHTCYHCSASFCSLDLHTIYHDSLCTCRSVRCVKPLLSIHSRKVAFSARCPVDVRVGGSRSFSKNARSRKEKKKSSKIMLATRVGVSSCCVQKKTTAAVPPRYSNLSITRFQKKNAIKLPSPPPLPHPSTQ